MRKMAVCVLTFFVLTLFSGCIPTNQAEQALDFVFGKPRVVEIEPKDGVENVNLNSEIKIRFSKEINESTLNNKTATISYLNEDLNFNVNPLLGSEYKYENKTLIIKPNEEFLPNQLIEVRLTSGIKNREGKELSHSGKGGESDNVRYVFKFKTRK